MISFATKIMAFSSFLHQIMIFHLLCLAVGIHGEIDINTVLPKGYQKGQRPNLRGPPTEVKVSIYVNSFGNIEEAQMEYKIYGYYRQYWNDGRLAGRFNESLVLKGDDIGKLWKPDPYCYNARESTLSASDSDISSMMTVEPNGDIVYSRMTIILAECDMDLRDFPMDTQRCFLKLSSYTYSKKHIQLSWSREGVTVAGKNLAQFYFTELETTTFSETYSLGEYSIIQVDFKFKRRLGYFLIQVFAPDVFIVMLSWIVFWMDRNDMGNRMALGITTILTIMFLMGSINAAMPRVSYPKALDWYLMISFALVFMALIQCTIVFVLVNRYEKKLKAEERVDSKTRSINKLNGKNQQCDHQVIVITENSKIAKRMAVGQNGASSPSTGSLSDDEKKKRSKNFGLWVDNMAKVVFPMVFLGFNVVYWLIYLD